MTLYLIGGLGADERVFLHLDIKFPTQVVKWIDPLKNESIEAFARRLSAQLDVSQPFGLLGVSFGGIIAIELSKIFLNPQIIILVSSVEIAVQLPQKYLAFGQSGILNVIPKPLIKPPLFIMKYLFGAQNQKLLKEIINDTDPAFIKWALNAMLSWRSTQKVPNVVRIHGTNDKIIPLKGEAIKIEGARHFMIVDQSEEIGKLVEENLNKTK